MKHELHLGDCLDVLKTLPENSVDSIVTDPPYGLSAAPNSGKKSTGGFMGKKWDYESMEQAMEEYSELRLANVGISLPKKNTGEMWSFLLVNALRCLTEEQRASLCFDLYCRNELTESIDERIRKLKEERQ